MSKIFWHFAPKNKGYLLREGVSIVLSSNHFWIVFQNFLKESINPGEDLLAFGTQKPENFNDKNRIYLAF